MTTAVVLGGADCLARDLDAYDGPADLVIACNDAGVEWAGRLDAWVSLHPEQFLHFGPHGHDRGQWLQKRAGKGHPKPLRLFAHLAADRASYKGRYPDGLEFTDYLFPGQAKSGSSGLFAAKVALIDMGADRVVFCGVPMVPAPHFFGGVAWKDAVSLRERWEQVPAEYRALMRSMSGWTADYLGKPE